MSNLTFLPMDLLISCCYYLHPKEFTALIKTCKKLHSLTSCESIYKFYCQVFKSCLWKPISLSWKQLFFLNIESVCPHLLQTIHKLLVQKVECYQDYLNSQNWSCTLCKMEGWVTKFKKDSFCCKATK